MASSQETIFGLGFLRSHNRENTTTTSTVPASSSEVLTGSTANGTGTGINTNNTSNNNNKNINNSNESSNDMDVLMQSYMQQCLSYHEQQHNNHHNNHHNTNNAEHLPLPAPVVFIPANSNSSNENDNHNENNSNNNINDQNINSQIENEINLKIQKAKLIAQKLASKPVPVPVPTVVAVPNMNQTNQRIQTIDTYPYAQKRQNFLHEIHNPKLHSFLLKNLNYILQKDEQIHSIQIQHLQEQREKQKQRKMQYENQQSKKRKRQHGHGHGRGHGNNAVGNIGNLGSGSGIGTEERNKIQNTIDKHHHSFLHANNTKRQTQKKSCSLYISGIKQIQIQTPNTQQQLEQLLEQQLEKDEQQEKMIHELFQSYGTIRHIHFYTNKQTGLRKGDALIVYDWKNNDDDTNNHNIMNENVNGNSHEHGDNNGDNNVNDDPKEDDKMNSFLKMICSQLNGVELPCGSILSVDVADMDYKSSNISNSSSASKKYLKQMTKNVTKFEMKKKDDTKNVVKNEEISNQTYAEVEEEKDDNDLDDFFASL